MKDFFSLRTLLIAVGCFPYVLGAILVGCTVGGLLYYYTK